MTLSGFRIGTMPPRLHVNADSRTFLGGSVAIFLLLLSHVISGTMIFDNILPAATELAVYFSASILIYSLLNVSTYNSRMLNAFCFSWLLIIAVQKLAFSVNTKTTPDISAIIECINFILFMSFYRFRAKPLFIMNSLMLISVAYLIYYCMLSYRLGSSDIDVQAARENVGYIGGGDDRDARVFLAGPLAAFVLYYSMVECLTKRNHVYLLPLLLSSYAIFIAQSRVFMVVSVISSFTILLPKPLIRWFVLACSIAFFSGVAFMASGILGWAPNPFSYFISDGSGWARVLEFAAARDAIEANFLFGSGIARTFSQEFQDYMKSFVPFFPSDLGPIGVWSYFGVFGLSVFLVCSWISFFPSPRITYLGPHATTLRAIAFAVAVYGIISPGFFFGSGRLFIGLLLYSIAIAPGYENRRGIRPSPVKSANDI